MEFPTFEQISTQVKDGLLDNTAQGKNEFVIRLKPEGIGEVIVKLSANREKIELNIFTSSIQTAKLIERGCGTSKCLTPATGGDSADFRYAGGI